MINETNYNELKEVISEAAVLKKDIAVNAKSSLKENKVGFARFMTDNCNDSELTDVLSRLGAFNGVDASDKKKFEKKKDSIIFNFFCKMYNKTLDFEFFKEGGKPKETTPPKHETYVQDLVASLFLSQYMPEMTRALADAGIEIKFTKTLTKLDLTDKNDKDVLDNFIQAGVDAKSEIEEKNLVITDSIFENIPDSMKYDAQSNPTGIKKSQFNTLSEMQAKTELLSEKGDADKAKDAVLRTADKLLDSSKNQELMSVVTESIVTPVAQA